MNPLEMVLPDASLMLSSGEPGAKPSSYVHAPDRPQGPSDGTLMLTPSLNALKKLLSSADHHL